MPAISLALALITLAAPPAAPKPSGQSVSSALAQAKVFYDEFEFERCVALLEGTALQTTSTELLAEVELYWGLCLFSLAQEPAAREHFWLAVRFGPAITPPVGTSPKVVAVFNQVKAQVSAERPPNPIQTAPPPEAPPKPRLRWLPALIAGVTALALTMGIVYGSEARRFELLARGATFESDQAAQRSEAIRRAQIANVAYVGAAIGAVATGICLFLTW